MNFFERIFLGFLCALSFSLAATPVAPPATGVPRIKGQGFSPQQIAAATERFRDALLGTGAFKLIEGEKVEALTEEKAMAEAGCYVSSCVAELGQAIGVERIILVTMTHVGKLLSAEARLIDVQSGRVVKSALVDSDRSFEKFVRKEVPLLAERLAGKASASAAVYAYPSDKPRSQIAILEMDANGVDSSESRGLTQRLGAEMFATGRFDIMEREQMAEILQEQAFQQTQCAGEDCIVQMGQLAGVEFMVGGSITRIGGVFSVSARLIDVGSGQIVRSSTVDVTGDLNKILRETLNDVARTLSGMEPRRRTNVPGWSWAGGALALAGLGGWMHWQAADIHNRYDREREDLDRIAQLRDQAWGRYLWAGGFYSLAAVAGGVSAWHFLRSDKEIRIRDHKVQVSLLSGSEILALRF